MTAKANPFRNRENYAKYLALYFEPGLTVLLTTLEWCYKGQRPIEEHLADLGATNFLRKKNTINATEQNSLEELKEYKTNLNALDITLLYKVIQLACGLLPRNDKAWTKACPTARQGELEFLLFQLKDGRNKLAHPRDEHKNITDQMVEDKCKEMKDLLTKLLQAAALKVNLDLNSSEFNKINKHIDDDIQRILKGENVCESMSDHTLDLILTDLKVKHFINDELKSTFKKEIEEYSAPSLKDKDSFHPLKYILQFDKSPVIVVQGEAGMGKTTMSRFFFYAWLSGNTDSVEELSSFDMVLRVDCNEIFCSDIHLFYETLLPSASFAFPNTNSLKRSLDKFKTLWIMDGCDESTAEFKGFLTAMANTLSEKHKLLITTRPNTYEDLQGILCKCKLSMTCLSLDLFQDHNVNEVIQSLIMEDEKNETFKTHISSLDKTAKHLLRTPLNLNLYIKLWKQDPELVTNTFTTKMLFLKTIDTNLIFLKERLYLRSSWSSKEDLKDFVNDWFYGSLCKQSFVMLMQGRYSTISTKDLVTWKKDARFSKLDPSTCLSSFLVQVKEYVEDEVENENDDDSEEWENLEENEGESENDDDVEEFENKEEDKGETSYKYVHLSQQFVLASLFLKHFKDYDRENVINSIITLFYEFGFERPKSVSRLIKFYVEMITEDGSLVSNLKQVFSPIQSIINSTPDIGYKAILWVTTSAASNFNVKYMETVSQAFKDIPYLNIYDFVKLSIFKVSLDVTNLTKFLEFVRPQKIILPNKILEIIQEHFQPLLEFLINSQLEIEFKTTFFDSWHNISRIYIKFNHVFCGTFDSFLIHREYEEKWTEELKTICINVNSEFQFYRIDFETLKEFKTLKRLEIWINLDSILLPIPNNIQNLPKEMVEKTTIGLIGLNIENFEKVLELLIQIKGEETLKFKALHHDFEDISETDKRQLQKMIHTVSIGFICQCKNYYISKTDKLNITSFVGGIQLLNALNAHLANLKSVCLPITYKREFYRTLKFLRDYKANLNKVKIELYYSFPELVNPENIISSNVFTIPQELMERTIICILTINPEMFHNYFTLLNNLRGDETLKFKAVYTDHTSLKHNQLEMLNQITGNSSCIKNIDFKNDCEGFFMMN